MANKNTNKQRAAKRTAFPAPQEINDMSDEEFEEYIKAQAKEGKTEGRQSGSGSAVENMPADGGYNENDAERGADKGEAGIEQRRRGYEDGRREILERWFRDTERLKKEVPDFDLDEAMKNNEFRNLVISGMSIDGAYYAVKYKEMNGGSRRPVMQNASSRAVKPGSSVNDMMGMNDSDFRKRLRKIMNGD
ncbi:MAG: hypothetical protein Q4G33_09415 [bacterium]|nr:hypothetical protein [bacterium]